MSSIIYFEKNRKSKVSKIMTFDKNRELIEEERYKGNRRVILEYKNKKLVNKREYAHVYPQRENILDGKSIYYNENKSIRNIDYYKNGSFLFTSYCAFDTSTYMYTLQEATYPERTNRYEKFGETCYDFDENKIVILSLYTKKNKSSKTALWLVVINPKEKKVKQEFFYTSKMMSYIENYTLTNSTYRSKIDKNVIDLVGVRRYGYDTMYESFNIQEKRIMVLKQPTFDMATIVEELKDKNITINLLTGMLFEEPMGEKNVVTYQNIVELLKKKGNARSQKFLEVQLAKFLILSNDEFQKYAVQRRKKKKVHPLIKKGFGKNYRTRLEKALMSQEISFSGKYVVAHWGCDEGKKSCETGGIVNTLTGVATPFPFKHYAHQGEKSYKEDSSLMVVAGDFEFADGTRSSNKIYTYTFTNGVFERLKNLTFICEEKDEI